MPGVMIFRLDRPVYYTNALTVRDRIKMIITEAETPPRAAVFDASARDQIDLTSMTALMYMRLYGNLPLVRNGLNWCRMTGYLQPWIWL